MCIEGTQLRDLFIISGGKRQNCADAAANVC